MADNETDDANKNGSGQNADSMPIHDLLRQTLPTEPLRHEIEIHIIPRLFVIHPLTDEKMAIKRKEGDHKLVIQSRG